MERLPTYGSKSGVTPTTRAQTLSHEALKLGLKRFSDCPSRDHRQNDMRSVRARMVDRLVRHPDLRIHAERLARVRVAVELREVATGDIHPNSVRREKHVARANEVDHQFVRLPCLE